jgi:hypothetical protein
LQSTLRKAAWVSVKLSDAITIPEAIAFRSAVLKSCNMDDTLPIPSSPTDDPFIKIHVDFLDEAVHETFREDMMKSHGRPGDYFYDLESPEWNKVTFPCRARHDPLVCKCHLPVYHIGQDEAIFKQNSLPSHYWTVNGHSKLRPKTDGKIQIHLFINTYFM